MYMRIDYCTSSFGPVLSFLALRRTIVARSRRSRCSRPRRLLRPSLQLPLAPHGVLVKRRGWCGLGWRRDVDDRRSRELGFALQAPTLLPLRLRLDRRRIGDRRRGRDRRNGGDRLGSRWLRLRREDRPAQEASVERRPDSGLLRGGDRIEVALARLGRRRRRRLTTRGLAMRADDAGRRGAQLLNQRARERRDAPGRRLRVSCSRRYRRDSPGSVSSLSTLYGRAHHGNVATVSLPRPDSESRFLTALIGRARAPVRSPVPSPAQPCERKCSAALKPRAIFLSRTRIAPSFGVHASARLQRLRTKRERKRNRASLPPAATARGPFWLCRFELFRKRWTFESLSLASCADRSHHPRPDAACDSLTPRACRWPCSAAWALRSPGQALRSGSRRLRPARRQLPKHRARPPPTRCARACGRRR